MTNDAGAKIIAKWLGFAWDGLSEGRISEKGFPIFPLTDYKFQGGKQDLRDLAEAILSAAPTASATVPVAWTTKENVKALQTHPKITNAMWGLPNGRINVPLFAAPPLPKEDGLREAEKTIARLARQINHLRRSLEKISSPTQTEGLLWWQIEARAALAAREPKP